MTGSSITAQEKKRPISSYLNETGEKGQNSKNKTLFCRANTGNPEHALACSQSEHRNRGVHYQVQPDNENNTVAK